MNMEDETQHIRKEVNEHITLIREARVREAGKRASAYLYTSSGALILSVSFLTITGFGNLHHTWLLIGSWLWLLGAIIAHLISYNLSDLSFNKNEKDVNVWVKSGMPIDSIPSETNGWTKSVRIATIVSSVATIFGLVSLVLFGIININTMSDEEKKIQGTEDTGSEQKQSEPTVSGPTLQDRLDANKPNGANSEQGDNSDSNQ